MMNPVNQWISFAVLITTTILIVNAVPTGKVKKQYNDLDKCGEPKPTYVMWKDLRQYIVRNQRIGIPGNYEGPPLQVMRCNNALSPCNQGDNCCGVYREKLTEKRLEIDTGDGIATLILEYVEPKKCRCVDEKRYEMITVEVDSVPFIFNATLEMQSAL